MINKLRSRYPGEHSKTVIVREFIARICSRHRELGLADSTFESNLLCADDFRHYQRLSEALFTHELLEVCLDILPSHQGPDILMRHDNSDVWIEVICPTPERVPREWLISQTGVAVSLPHEDILLRWTAAIKEKAQKLIGVPSKNEASAKPGYLEKGLVACSDPYVIAVNGRLLRGDVFGSIFGISQFPYAVEAVFPVGPYEIKINSRTLEAINKGHQYRPTIQNHNGSSVPADMFLDPAFEHISAIWAADMDGTYVIGNSHVLAVVHNPNAANSIPPGLLPAHWEYFASRKGDIYEIGRQTGRLYRDK